MVYHLKQFWENIDSVVSGTCRVSNRLQPWVPVFVFFNPSLKQAAIFVKYVFQQIQVDALVRLKVPDLFLQTQLRVIDNTTCNNYYYQADRLLIQEDMICTLSGPTGTENACNGDSGSALMTERNGRSVLTGVVSFGLNDCPEDFPSVFSRTSFYLEWMKAAIVQVP